MSHAWVKEAVPDPIRRRLRLLRRALADAGSYPGLALSRMALMGELIAAVLPPRRPPILVISMPRSGSSWIGSVLGASEGALYLREPMTQSYLGRVGGDAGPAFELDMCRDRRAYEQFAYLAFRGIPRFDKSIVLYPEQWAISGRAGKQVVVKEVNPFVIEGLWERFQPKIIFLVRHPVAVLRSIHTLSRTDDQFRGFLSAEALASLERRHAIPASASFWEQGGAVHAIVQNRVMSFVTKVDHTTVRYEDVCEEPLAGFERIFDYCGLPFSAAVREKILRSSYSEAAYIPGRYDTMRDSRDMKDRWKYEIDPEHIKLARRGYFDNQPSFYRDERDW